MGRLGNLHRACQGSPKPSQPAPRYRLAVKRAGSRGRLRLWTRPPSPVAASTATNPSHGDEILCDLLDWVYSSAKISHFRMPRQPFSSIVEVIHAGSGCARRNQASQGCRIRLFASIVIQWRHNLHHLVSCQQMHLQIASRDDMRSLSECTVTVRARQRPPADLSPLLLFPSPHHSSDHKHELNFDYLRSYAASVATQSHLLELSANGCAPRYISKCI